MKQLKLYLFFLFIISGNFTFSQVAKYLHLARKCSDKFQYQEAKQYYTKALAIDSMNMNANGEMAELLFFDMENYEEAYMYLKRVLRVEKDTTVTMLYTLGKCEQYKGDFKSSEIHFKRFEDRAKNDRNNKELRDEVVQYIKNIDYEVATADSSADGRVRLVNVGKSINTAYPEYVPVVSESESLLMFTSRRKNALNKHTNSNEEQYSEDMYVAKRSGSNFELPSILPSLDKENQQLKNSPRNESLISLSPDGKTLFLYKRGAIYSSTLTGGIWSEPKLLDEKIISDAFENHATITADGKTLYFTSERKGGLGGLDIYRTEKNADGTWSIPENIGKDVNTDKDEESPYITPDGKILYFSSKGLQGYGEHDIYKSKVSGKTFSKPENLGLPFNSPADDIFFYPHQDLSEGYLSSNRNGGFGDLDIYRFYYIDKPDFHVNPDQVIQPELLAKINKLEESMSADPKSVEGNLRAIKNDKGVANVFFKLNDSIVSNDPKALGKNINSKGNNSLQLEVIRNCDTCIYLPSYVVSKTFTIADIVTNTNNNTNTSSALSASDLKPVYFDFAKRGVRTDNEKILMENIEKLKSYSGSITVFGYTDSRGPAAFNKKLSGLRAHQVKEYLVSKGIDKKRIKVEAMGEENPAVDCKDACTEEQHQLNRRVELRAEKR